MERGNAKRWVLAAASSSSRRPRVADAMLLHACVAEQALESDLVVGNSLLNLYGKCGSFAEMERALRAMPRRDVVSWTTAIDAHARDDAGDGDSDDAMEALGAFRAMRSDGVSPNSVTFVSLLRAFRSPASLAKGQEAHASLQAVGLGSDRVLGNSLISMYGRCGGLREARHVFDRLRGHRDVVSWNAMISAYSRQGCGELAIEAFARLSAREGLAPNRITFVAALDACSSDLASDEGRLVHGMIAESAIAPDVVIDTALLDMYGKCGSIADAHRIFRGMPEPNVVSWTAIISSFARKRWFLEALEAFGQMVARSGIRPNAVTYAAALDACASPAFASRGRLIHFSMACSEAEAASNAGLVSMYAACGGLLEDAIAVFEGLPKPDVVAWTAMIGAYAQHDLGEEAAACFARMLQSGIEPNEITFVCVLDACQIDGELVHHQIAEAGIPVSGGDLGTALIGAYGKHGMGLREARAVFRGVMRRDIVCWNVMLAAYAQQGYGEEALELYRALEEEQQRQETDLRPNAFTFVSVLGACGHGGLVELASRCFASMQAELRVEHCICAVDLLGRAGRVDEAHRFAEQMPLPPSATLWMSLLGSCRLHHDLERGKLAADNVRQLEPRSVRACVLLSNIHASTRAAAAEEETQAESCIDP